MIKIIKRGTRQQASCERCGCLFSYEEEDIKHLEGHCDGNYAFIDGTKHGYKNYVECPQCNNEVIVSQTRFFSAESEVKE